MKKIKKVPDNSNFTLTLLSLGGVYLTLLNGTLLSCQGRVIIMELLGKTSCSRFQSQN